MFGSICTLGLAAQVGRAKLLPSLVAVPGPLTFDRGNIIRW
jgi:hypothetical protein